MSQVFTCDICGQAELSESGMQSHFQLTHIEMSLNCPFCELADVALEELNTHIMYQHPDNNSFSENGRISKPIENVGYLQCPLCELSEISEERLQAHVNTAHLDLLSPSKEGLTTVIRSTKLLDPTNQAEEMCSNKSTESKLENSCGKTDVMMTCPLCSLNFDSYSSVQKHFDIMHEEDQTVTVGMETGKVEQDLVSDLCAPSDVACNEAISQSSNVTSDCDQSSLKQNAVGVFDTKSCNGAKLFHDRQRRIKNASGSGEKWRKLGNKVSENKESFQLVEYRAKQRDRFLRLVNEQPDRSCTTDAKSTFSNFLIDNGSSCTRGLIEQLKELANSGKCKSTLFLCSAADHYASTSADRGWGCGYRNAQMLLSSLSQWALYQKLLFGNGRQMPSIEKLQSLIEAGWKQGFDRVGRDQLGGTLLGTRKWIGTTEVIVLLSQFRIRYQVVDFHTPTGSGNTHSLLLQWVEKHFTSNATFKPPLYLQHQGHSRTIVGCERTQTGKVNLIMFDPCLKPEALRNSKSVVRTLNLLRQSDNRLTAKQYQILVVKGVIETDEEYEACKHSINMLRIP